MTTASIPLLRLGCTLAIKRGWTCNSRSTTKTGPVRFLWLVEKSQIKAHGRMTGPDTQAYLSGTTVAFLSLHRLTGDYQKIIASAKKADLAKALPAGADKTLLEGYKAQQAAILTDYKSPDAAVHELAFGGGETVPLVVLKPLSRGSILINSSKPLADPVFDYGTFQHPVDIQVAVAMYKKFRQFVAAEPWKAVGMTETTPGPSVEGDAAIEAAIRNITQSTWSHPVGTCAMLPRRYGGVVDPQLRVYGVDALSVVDASVMPTIPASHTSSTVYAVAEKVSSNPPPLLIPKGPRLTGFRGITGCGHHQGATKEGIEVEVEWYRSR